MIKNRTFTSVPDKITIFEYDKVIRLEYIKERQDSHHCILLSLSGEYITPKDYRIRFMDTQGNPLDKEILDDLDYIRADISYNYKGVINVLHLDTLTSSFYDKMERLIVSTALKRKTELLDFFDPQVWKDSCDPEVVDIDKMEYLNKVRGFRSKEENMILEYMSKDPLMTYREACIELNLVEKL